MSVVLAFLFYNLQEGRPLWLVRTELRALATFFRPVVLCGVEGVGYDLRPIRGYTLIHDRSRPSRANVFAYVRKGRHLRDVEWHDLTETWHNTQHPGMHEPRSTLTFLLEGVRVVVGHQPQHPATTRFHDTLPAMREGAAAFVAIMAPETLPDWDAKTEDEQRLDMDRPVIALADWNDGFDGAPTARSVAKKVQGTVVGFDIDKAVIRNARPGKVKYVAAFPYLGKLLLLRSDHKHALLVKVQTWRRWWPAK